VKQGRASQDAIFVSEDIIAVIDGHGEKSSVKTDSEKGKISNQESPQCEAVRNILKVLQNRRFDKLCTGSDSFNEEAKRATAGCFNSGACCIVAKINMHKTTGKKFLEIFSIGDVSAVVINSNGKIKHVQKHHNSGGYPVPRSVLTNISSGNFENEPLNSFRTEPRIRITGSKVTRFGGRNPDNMSLNFRTLAMFASFGDHDVSTIIHDGNVEHVDVESGDAILVCTDGIADMWSVGDLAEWAAAIAHSADPKVILSELEHRTIKRWTQPVWTVDRDALGLSPLFFSSFSGKVDDRSVAFATVP